MTARIDAEIAPPVRLFARLAEMPPMRRFAVAATLLVALGGALVLGGAPVFRGGSRSDPAGAGATGSIPLAMEPNVRLVRIGGQGLTTSGPLLLAQPGDMLVAEAASSVRLDDRTTIALEPRARLRLRTRDEVTVLEGRATFDVAHDETRPFAVETATLRVVDLGTRFAVEVSAQAAGERVLVSVEQGRVRVAPVSAVGLGAAVGSDGTVGPAAAEEVAGASAVLELVEGQGLAFVAGRPTGVPYALSTRPTLSLEADDLTASRDRPVTVRLVFHNPTDGWLALPTYDPVRAPLHVEVTAPDGSVQAVRVSESMLVDGGGSGSSLPPRGHLAIRVRFEHTFASPGTYRLRAIYRPAGAVDEGASPELVLPVR